MPAINTLIVLGVVAFSAVVLFLGILIAVKKFYIVPKADEALVKTGGKRPVVSTGGGLWVVPMFHEVARVSLQAIRVPIDRTGQDAVPSKDMIPAEIKGEMFVQINPQDEQAIVLAVQSLGTSRPTEMGEVVRQKIDSQVTDALRTSAFQKTFIELNSQKKEFADEVVKLLQEDLAKLGLTLTAVSVTHVSQGPFTSDVGDIIAAQGRRNVAETVERNRQETNLITRNAEIEVQLQDVDAREKALALDLRRRQKEADQARQVEEYEAEQHAEAKKKVLLQTQAEEEAQAAQHRAIAEARAKEAELAEKAEIAKLEQIAIRQAQAEAAKKAEQEKAAIAIAKAEAQRKVADEEAARLKEEAEIARQRAVEQANIDKQRAVKVADEQRQQAIEEAEVARQVAVAQKRAEEAAARASQARAESEQRAAEEQVITVKAEAEASRQKQIVTIRAQEEAEKEKIAADKAAYVEAKKAEGERDAAVKRAEAVKAEAEGRAQAKEASAQGDAQAITIAAQAYATDVSTRADADAEAADKQAAAKIKLAEATLKEGQASAEAERLMVEARNAVDNRLILRDLTLAAIQQAPQVVHELMAPVANVAHDVKILQVTGLGGENGAVEGLPATILNTGLAAAGIKPFLAEALRTVSSDPDVKETVGQLSGVLRGAIREAAAGVKDGLGGESAEANGAAE